MSDLSDPGEYEHYGAASEDVEEEEEEDVEDPPGVTAADFEEAARAVGGPASNAATAAAAAVSGSNASGGVPSTAAAAAPGSNAGAAAAGAAAGVSVNGGARGGVTTPGGLAALGLVQDGAAGDPLLHLQRLRAAGAGPMSAQPQLNAAYGLSSTMGSVSDDCCTFHAHGMHRNFAWLFMCVQNTIATITMAGVRCVHTTALLLTLSLSFSCVSFPPQTTSAFASPTKDSGGRDSSSSGGAGGARLPSDVIPTTKVTVPRSITQYPAGKQLHSGMFCGNVLLLV